MRFTERCMLIVFQCAQLDASLWFVSRHDQGMEYRCNTEAHSTVLSFVLMTPGRIESLSEAFREPCAHCSTIFPQSRRCTKQTQKSQAGQDDAIGVRNFGVQAVLAISAKKMVPAVFCGDDIGGFSSESGALDRGASKTNVSAWGSQKCL